MHTRDGARIEGGGDVGVAARRQETKACRGVQQPRLRLVSNAPKKSTKTRQRAAASAARQVFVMFAIVVTAVSLLGLGRVWLTVQAAEASLEASRLRTEIKDAQYDGDMLEIRQSSLGSPSRIRAIADATMDMAPAAEVTYLEIAKRESAADDQDAAVSDDSVVKRAVASVLDLTAGEAQVLLVGDVGLASAR